MYLLICIIYLHLSLDSIWKFSFFFSFVANTDLKYDRQSNPYPINMSKIFTQLIFGTFVTKTHAFWLFSTVKMLCKVKDCIAFCILRFCLLLHLKRIRCLCTYNDLLASNSRKQKHNINVDINIRDFSQIISNFLLYSTWIRIYQTCYRYSGTLNSYIELKNSVFFQ